MLNAITNAANKFVSYFYRCRMGFFIVAVWVSILLVAAALGDDDSEPPAEPQNVLDYVNSANTTWKVIKLFSRR